MSDLATTVDRIMGKVEQITESGCWIYLGYVNEYGYAQANFQGRQRAVHRLMYEYFRGPIPNEFPLDHLCRVRCCVNPHHTRAVTQRENVLAPGSLSLPKLQSERSHCRNGHPLIGANLTPSHLKKGWRNCAQCAKQAYIRYHARKKAAHG